MIIPKNRESLNKSFILWNILDKSSVMMYGFVRNFIRMIGILLRRLSPVYNPSFILMLSGYHFSAQFTTTLTGVVVELSFFTKKYVIKNADLMTASGIGFTKSFWRYFSPNSA